MSESSEKHTTFNDVVTVFDSFERTVTEEKLHDAPFDQDEGEGEPEADTSSYAGSEEAPSSPGKGGGGFFLDDAEADLPEDEVSVKVSVDVADGVAGEDVAKAVAARKLETQLSNTSSNSNSSEDKKTKKEAEMMNIFSNFGAPPDALASDADDVLDGPGSGAAGGQLKPKRKTSATKSVDLKSLMKAMDEQVSAS